MKRTIQTLIIILLTLIISFLTTCMLEIEWVASNWVRIHLVYLMVMIEIGLGVLMVRQIGKN